MGGIALQSAQIFIPVFQAQGPFTLSLSGPSSGLILIQTAGNGITLAGVTGGPFTWYWTDPMGSFSNTVYASQYQKNYTVISGPLSIANDNVWQDITGILSDGGGGFGTGAAILEMRLRLRGSTAVAASRQYTFNIIP